MKFIEKIKALKEKYAEDCSVMNNAFLYGLKEVTPPLAEHIVFSPMPQKVMDDMIYNYLRTFPKELLELFRYMNGAALFWTTCVIGKSGNCIPISCLDIFGVPLTNDRIHIEPYNISIEDLRRPKETPDSWLKFGAFYRRDNLFDTIWLFVDVDSSKVFAVEDNDEVFTVTDHWSSIDDCLCSIFDLLDKNKTNNP